METANLGVTELRIVAANAEKALDACIAEYQATEGKIMVLLRAVIAVPLSAVGLLITSDRAELFLCPILVLVAGSLITAVFLVATEVSKKVKPVFPGSTWVDFKRYRVLYGEEEKGLLRYMIDVCLKKIEVARYLCKWNIIRLYFTVGVSFSTIIASGSLVLRQIPLLP